MSMNRPAHTSGISRIDQPEKHNHGFFVRVQRSGKMHTAFFTDLKLGGRRRALAAAQRHHRKLLKQFKPMTRRRWAELLRRKGSSGIVGVQRSVDRRFTEPRVVWKATWSPKPYFVRRRQFSARKYGARNARWLAIRARIAGLRSMQP